MENKEIRMIFSRRFAGVKRSKNGVWTGRDIRKG